MIKIKDILKEIRNKITKLYYVEKSLQHSENIREYELNLIIKDLSKEYKILEIGAGTGFQSNKLKEMGFDITAIDIRSSIYKTTQLSHVIDYDGKNIPFDDNSFDIIYSSNVLEYLVNIDDFQTEIKRVLNKDGTCIHILPTSMVFLE